MYQICDCSVFEAIPNVDHRFLLLGFSNCNTAVVENLFYIDLWTYQLPSILEP